MLVAELRFPYNGLLGKKGMYRMYIFRECLILGGLGGWSHVSRKSSAQQDLQGVGHILIFRGRDAEANPVLPVHDNQETRCDA